MREPVASGRPRSSAWRGLLADSLLLMAASQVGNLANLLFQVFMMRRLPGAEYAALASMLGLALALGLPLDAGRSWVAHVSARCFHTGQMVRLRAWLRAALRRVTLVALGTTLLLFGFRAPLAAFFHVGSGLLPVLTGSILALTLFQPILIGALQGMESYGGMSVAMQAPSLLRLFLGVGLVFVAGATAVQALTAQGIAVGASLALGLVWLRRTLDRQAVAVPDRNEKEEPAGWSYALRSLAVLAGAGVLLNTDVVMAGKYFDSTTAGLFARSATIARAIVFLPGPIAMALFPKVASSGRERPGDRRLLAVSALVTALLIGAAGVAAVLGMPWIYPALTGRAADAATLLLTRRLLMAMSPLGVLMLLLNYAMAQRRFRAAYPLVLWAGLYIGAVALRHRSPMDIAGALALFGGLAVLSLAVALTRKNRSLS